MTVKMMALRWSASASPVKIQFFLPMTVERINDTLFNYTYNARNRLTNMIDAVGSTAYAYDAVGQLLSEGGLWSDDTVNYTYANRLRLGLSLEAPNASSWEQTYGYDSARRLTSITSPAGEFDYAYDPGALPR